MIADVSSGGVSGDSAGQILGPGGTQNMLGPGGTQDVPQMPINISMSGLKDYFISCYGEADGTKLYNMFYKSFIMAMINTISGAQQGSLQRQKDAAQGM